jgi:hypothetical protein
MQRSNANELAQPKIGLREEAAPREFDRRRMNLAALRFRQLTRDLRQRYAAAKPPPGEIGAAFNETCLVLRP